MITVTFPSFRICTLFNRKLTCRFRLVSCFWVGVSGCICIGIGSGSGGIGGSGGGKGGGGSWRPNMDAGAGTGGIAEVNAAAAAAAAAGDTSNRAPACPLSALSPVNVVARSCSGNPRFCNSRSNSWTSRSKFEMRASFVSIIALYVLLLGLGVWIAFSNCIWSERSVSFVALSSWASDIGSQTQNK